MVRARALFLCLALLGLGSQVLGCHEALEPSIPIPKDFPSLKRQTEPAWSPDGKLIAYTYYPLYVPTDSSQQIWILDLRDRRVRYLTLGRLPAWSPDGKSLSFVRYRQIIVRDFASGSERRLTNWDACLRTTWSPHGDSLAFWLQNFYPVPSDSAGIRIASLADGHDRLVLPFGNSWPSWSGSDSTLAVVTAIPDAFPYDELAVFNTHTGKLNRVTFNDRDDYYPAMSFDGSRIAWDSQRSGHVPTLWVMNVDGTGGRDLGIEGDLPAWSPDGTTIAYSGYDKSSNTDAIWGVDLASGARTRLSTPQP